MKCTINLFTIAERFQNILMNSGVTFKENGYPDLTSYQYIEKLPHCIEVFPYSKRNQAKNPRKTALTFFEDDGLLYRDLNAIDKVVSNLSLYYAATGFDLSPCINYSHEVQNVAVLLNALTNGLFLDNGIKIIPSLRTGDVGTIDVIKCYPQNICFAFGALGCNQKFQTYAQCLSVLKLVTCKPSQILVYGKLSNSDKEIFENWNVPFRSFLDYQTCCRQRTAERNRHNG